jgi:hypothetical protein
VPSHVIEASDSLSSAHRPTVSQQSRNEVISKHCLGPVGVLLGVGRFGKRRALPDPTSSLRGSDANQQEWPIGMFTGACSKREAEIEVEAQELYGADAHRKLLSQLRACPLR